MAQPTLVRDLATARRAAVSHSACLACRATNSDPFRYSGAGQQSGPRLGRDVP
jgi:hypothetical protein